jgi:hypothetical protein
LHCQISRGAPAGQDREARGQSRLRCTARPARMANPGRSRAARPRHDRSARSHQASVRPDPAIVRLSRALPDLTRSQRAARPDLAAEPHGQIWPAMLVGDDAGHSGVWRRGHRTCTVAGRRRQFLQKRNNIYIWVGFSRFGSTRTRYSTQIRKKKEKEKEREC